VKRLLGAPTAKQWAVLAFAAVVLGAIVGAATVLRTRWAGDRLCATAKASVRKATGLELEVDVCRFEPWRLGVTARGVRLGPKEAPLVVAESVRARLALLQALAGRLELAELVLVRPRVKATIPPSTPDAKTAPPSVLKGLSVHRLTVVDGALGLALPDGGRLLVGRVDVNASPSLRRRLAGLMGGRAGLDVALANVSFETGARRTEAEIVRASADLYLDLSRLVLRSFSAQFAGAGVSGSGTVRNLRQPQVALDVTVGGGLSPLLALLGRADIRGSGRAEANFALRGPVAALKAEGSVRFERAVIGGWGLGDVSARWRWAARELRIEQLELPAVGGRVIARGRVRFGEKVKLDAEASLERVELGELLARLKLPGAFVMGRLTGKARVSGSALPLALVGEVGLDLSDFRVLGHRWERARPGESAFLDLRRGRVDGDLHVDRSGIKVDAARVKGGAATLVTRGVFHFNGGRGFELAGEGDVDLSELRHLGEVPVGGLAHLSNLHLRAAPYGAPRIEGMARIKDFRFLRLELGEVATELTYDRLVLHALRVDGQRGSTRYQGEVTVEFGKGAVRVREARYAAQGKLRDFFDATLPWQADAASVRDALDGEVALRGTASGPAVALDAVFAAELAKGQLFGRAFDAGALAVRIERSSRAVFEHLELRRGGGLFSGSGVVGLLHPFPWDLEWEFAGIALAGLALPGEEWQGTVSGGGTLRGSGEVPILEFALRGQGVGLYASSLGSVKMGGRLERKALSLTGSIDGARFAGSANLVGRAPFQARLEFDLAEGMRLMARRWAGVHVRARGVATASGEIRAFRRARAELRLEELRLGYGDFKVAAAEPMALSLAEGRVVVRSFSLRGSSTQFTLSGECQTSGALALDARGSLDLRLLGGVIPGVMEPSGQLAIEAHVGGRTGEPLLVGTGRLREASFRWHEMPFVLRGLGGELSISQNRMVFDHLAAQLNGGRAEFAGEVELKHLFPARMRVDALVDQVPLRIPEWLSSVVSGRLEAAGTWDEMVLSGKLHVVRALCTERVDLEKRIMESRKRPVPRPFDRTGEWLALDIALALDGDVRIENDLVRGALGGALTLTGTAAGVGLVGTLTMVQGSRATFRGNEFVLRQAVVDFVDRRRVRMNLDVHGDAQVRDYQVHMHLSGSHEDPTVQLTSQPALSQQDIVTLLSLGYTTRDTAATGGVVTGVATAAAAQALFSASGLDEQVRRFVPTGGLLRDFSVRMTSSYSELSGQVEPRAELESKVLDERFRLRYQAPLNGTRGQRAQAEMRLSPRTSLQYQWDNENPDIAAPSGDHGLDLKLRWEWND